MTWITPLFLFVVAWLAVFAQTQFRVLHELLGTPVSLLPAIVVYAGLSHPLGVATGLSVMASLWVDSLSTTRLGVSTMPLFLVTWMVYTKRQVILRDQIYAQFWLGVGAGAAVPILTLLILRSGDRQPYSGWATLWHLVVSSAFNGLFCPLFFRLFDGVRGTFEYQIAVEPPFRSDREIQYGRRRS